MGKTRLRCEILTQARPRSVEMAWSDSVGILQDMGRGCRDDDGLEPLLREFYASAVRHSHLRAE